MKNPNLNRNGSYYGAWKTEFGDWMIVNSTVHCYLLIGSTSALLIDTAYGQGDLRYFVESLTDLPITVVNTHGHTDHSGGNAFWSEVWMGHSGEVPAKSMPYLKKMPYPDYQIHFIEDGQLFDLGNRKVEAITLCGHHTSSVAFLDQKNRSLYSGDEIDSSQVFLFDEVSHTPTKEMMTCHLHSMEKLKKRISDFDRIIPAHNGAPITNDYIDDFITLSEKYLAGEIIPEETVAGYGMPTFIFGGDKKLYRIKYKHASFIIDKKTCFV